jgi:hypothetical protein
MDVLLIPVVPHACECDAIEQWSANDVAHRHSQIARFVSVRF